MLKKKYLKKQNTIAKRITEIGNTALKIKPKIEEALEKLTDAQKYVIHLSYYEGYTLNEIAEKLNIPIETVRMKINAALHNLKDNLIS